MAPTNLHDTVAHSLNTWDKYPRYFVDKLANDLAKSTDRIALAYAVCAYYGIDPTNGAVDGTRLFANMQQPIAGKITLYN